ncbi:hypothetical protein HN958_00625 [Candidatus Falkowbacteria bacterium]|jgi:hypothetical protein|nr:hypothetical protein [Candidatus Falkowbacteria bacterium]MBT7006994.1 hypothetical protein [Candidatus Falkowbacteria bacterium]
MLDKICDWITAYGLWREIRTLPGFIHQVSWLDYLGKLADKDRVNVETLCRRLQVFSEFYKLPLAIVAIGSVLNPIRKQRKDLVASGYSDIDLLLVPILSEDSCLDRAERAFGHFVLNQPEIYFPPKAELTDDVEDGFFSEIWDDYDQEEVSRYWTLIFHRGKHVQIFSKTSPFWLMTLRQLMRWESGRSRKDTFAYKIIK